jgi:hypothetical protein
MVGLQGEREVFYAVPFQAPPNLQIEAPDGINWNFVKLKEQKADRFVVQYSWGMGSPIEVRWRAEGVRGGHHP